LSRSFAEQGLKIRIRKETRLKRQANSMLDTSSESSSSSLSEGISSPTTLISSGLTKSALKNINQHSNNKIRRKTSDIENTSTSNSIPPHYSSIYHKKQLTEQEQSAQSALMLLANFHFLQSNLEAKPESPPPYPVNMPDTIYSISSSFDDMFGKDPLGFSGPINTLPMANFYTYRGYSLPSN
jgi:hypothetical protein